MTRSRFVAFTLATMALASAALGCMRATASAEGIPLSGVPTTTPTLVVLITVDQLRGDMLDRYGGDMRGGYGRLMRGAWYTNAYQDHAITETAPGHASLLSGRFPRSTGIFSNTAGVIDPRYRLLSGMPYEVGASPERFQGSALFDWLSARNGKTRALSVSKKDRGAILPIGRSKQDVYWLSNSGEFTTSNYYRDSLPRWVRQFNARRIAHGYAGAEWRLSRDPASYTVPDSIPFEKGGRDFVFPHPFPQDSAPAAAYIAATPSVDSLTALFAIAGVRALDLGSGPQTDILAVSFSGTDYIGHTYGPDSREAYENQLRLDETIGWLVDSLYRMRDSSRIAIVLTADHGVFPIPELARARGQASGDQGMRVTLAPQVTAVRSALAAAGVDSSAFIYEGEIVALDRGALAGKRINADSVLDAFAAAARRVRGVARVDRVRNIMRADFAADPVARRWAHQLPAATGVDLVITLTPYSLWGTITASHGSPYDMDAHVPIIFYGPWFKPGRYSDFARTVDIAPTLAAILGVRPAEKLDGFVLTNAIQR